MDSVNVTLDVNLFVMEESKAAATTSLPADATFRRR